MKQGEKGEETGRNRKKEKKLEETGRNGETQEKKEDQRSKPWHTFFLLY